MEIDTPTSPTTTPAESVPSLHQPSSVAAPSSGGSLLPPSSTSSFTAPLPPSASPSPDDHIDPISPYPSPPSGGIKTEEVPIGGNEVPQVAIEPSPSELASNYPFPKDIVLIASFSSSLSLVFLHCFRSFLHLSGMTLIHEI